MKAQTETKSKDLKASEWTFKRILFRLIAYPFCLFIIGLGIYMIISPVNWKSQGAGIGAIIIASTYLRADLKILIKNKNARMHNKM